MITSTIELQSNCRHHETVIMGNNIRYSVVPGLVRAPDGKNCCFRFFLIRILLLTEFFSNDVTKAGNFLA